ncbi:hypothetical protein N7492_002781 [Penicillium capsulatum]|uniref:Uncharacterized protein n=1 Tax=Penicillium capsulatum TaxID=69766 RepID=A0A9W9IM02_9EURO|nr:hypothetical protein N7492_002781 [Penicillium capsulatum]KAJ6122622.1 hypothetical protein N7512_005087 [Penicillium capsulatum]
MSGNYDYPPASSRRPPRSREVRIPETSERIGPRGQTFHDFHDTHDRLVRQTHLVESLNAQRDLQILNAEEPDLETILSEIRFGALAAQESGGTPRDGPRSPPQIRDRLRYLRSLIHSESNRSNAEDTLRALETLNQEIEDHHLDQARNRGAFEQARATVDHQLRHIQPNPNRQAFYEASRPFFASEVSDPRPPGTRTLRRRSFRPDLRESLPTASLMPQSTHGRGRPKRRKLESDDNREGMRGFNYGHHGQVVPGALKMEIASCDGGIYDPDGDCSFADNILRNDQSVYCTKSDRCNLVLRHRGEAPFCLKKIVIKAPESGFDSPIQEGMVFVSMTADELLARTAQYQIQYSNARRRCRTRRPGIQPSQEYLTGLRSRSPLQSLDRTILMGPGSHSNPDVEAAGQDTHDPQSEFRVTTEYEEHSDDNIFFGSQDDGMSSTADPAGTREEDLPCTDSEDDSLVDGDDDDDIPAIPPTDSFARRLEVQRRAESLSRHLSGQPPRRRQGPSLVDPIPPSGSNGTASHPEVLKPHARFFIEREKSMVSIKFHPPPSGRYILIKLWSPRSDGNIDIQSIIAHGYAGPRFFPSGGFR